MVDMAVEYLVLDSRRSVGGMTVSERDGPPKASEIFERVWTFLGRSRRPSGTLRLRVARPTVSDPSSLFARTIEARPSSHCSSCGKFGAVTGTCWKS